MPHYRFTGALADRCGDWEEVIEDDTHSVGIAVAPPPVTTEIDEPTYTAERAAIIAWREAQSPPAPPPSPELVAPSAATVATYTVAGGGALATAKTILSKADADITPAELKTLVIIMARWLLKKVVVDGWR